MAKCFLSLVLQQEHILKIKEKQTAIITKIHIRYTLEPALVSGLTSAGMHVYTLGPLPTNGLVMLTKK